MAIGSGVKAGDRGLTPIASPDAESHPETEPEVPVFQLRPLPPVPSSYQRPRGLFCGEGGIRIGIACQRLVRKSSGSMPACLRIARNVPSGISPGWFGIVV